jgi:hypothetical protein
MQTAKIKTDAIYAMERGGDLVRFHCTEIVTRRGLDGTKSEIRGYVIEDRTDDGSRKADISVDPANLLGPYEEQLALVERKKQEEAKREAAAAARVSKAIEDRRLLYKFVGAEVPKNAKDYDQMFSVSYGSLEFRSEGREAIIQRIRAMYDKPKLTAVSD